MFIPPPQKKKKLMNSPWLNTVDAYFETMDVLRADTIYIRINYLFEYLLKKFWTYYIKIILYEL